MASIRCYNNLNSFQIELNALLGYPVIVRNKQLNFFRPNRSVRMIGKKDRILRSPDSIVILSSIVIFEPLPVKKGGRLFKVWLDSNFILMDS